MLSLILAVMLIRGDTIVQDAPNWRAKGFVPAEQVQVITVTTNPANAAVAERFSWAWWMVTTSARYGATNATKLANLAVMAEAAKQATTSDERDGILADAAMLSEVENNLTRNAGDWQSCLADDGSEKITATTNTVWRPIP